MDRLEKGAAVSHGAYGRGTVTAVRHSGYEVLVSFGRYSLWLPVRELEPMAGGLRLVDDPGRPEAEKQTDTGKKSADQIIRMLTNGSKDNRDPVKAAGTQRARKSEQPAPRYSPCRENRPFDQAVALESFRLGVVPQTDILEWTVGRDDEVARIGSFLRDDAEGAIVIEGAYGAGKTHLLAYLAHEAVGLGYAVATAGFDPSEAAAAFPKKAWRRLARGFSAPVVGGRVDLRGFLDAVVKTPDWKDVLGGHWLLGPFLNRLALGRVNELDWEWLEGRGLGRAALPTLHDFTTCANLYCSLLSGLGRAAELIGLNGLAVLLDEAEVARNVLYKYQFLRGLNFFRGLVMTANDEHVLLEEDVRREDNVTRGTVSGLVYSGHNQARYSAQIPSFLKVAFALTPGSLQQEFRRYRESIQTVTVDVLSKGDLRVLFNRICDRFESVYGVGLSAWKRESAFRLLASTGRVSSTREFIKGAVEMLDSIRFFPDSNVGEVLRSTGHGHMNKETADG